MNPTSTKTQILGNLLIYLLKLQAFFLVFTFLGGVVLGIFPSLATVLDYLVHSLDKKQDDLNLTFSTYKKRWSSYFKSANLL